MLAYLSVNARRTRDFEVGSVSHKLTGIDSALTRCQDYKIFDLSHGFDLAYIHNFDVKAVLLQLLQDDFALALVVDHWRIW